SLPASPRGRTMLSVAKRFEGRLGKGMRLAHDLDGDPSGRSRRVTSCYWREIESSRVGAGAAAPGRKRRQWPDNERAWLSPWRDRPAVGGVWPSIDGSTVVGSVSPEPEVPGESAGGRWHKMCRLGAAADGAPVGRDSAYARRLTRG